MASNCLTGLSREEMEVLDGVDPEGQVEHLTKSMQEAKRAKDNKALQAVSTKRP